MSGAWAGVKGQGQTFLFTLLQIYQLEQVCSNVSSSFLKIHIDIIQVVSALY